MATTLDKPQAPAPAPPQETKRPPVEPLLVQCASCGAPIAFDQTYCLECGAKSDRQDGWLSRFKTRRYLLGGLAVLLAIGGIVGYAPAAARRPHAVKVASKSVPATPPANQGPAAPPPAGAAPAPGAPPAAPTTPPPAAGKPAAPASPPASHPSTPAPSTPSHSSTPSTPQHAQPSTPAPSTSKPPYAKLFSSGRAPVSAGKFDPNKMGGVDANSLSKVFDNDASTVWKSGTYSSGVGNGVGFYVDNGTSDTIKGLGILTKTPGF